MFNLLKTQKILKELIRTEEEKLRAAARREAQQRRIRERPRMAGLTSGFLEGYDSGEFENFHYISIKSHCLNFSSSE